MLSALLLLFGLSWKLTAQNLPRVVQSEKHKFTTEVVIDKLQNPWGVVRLPDGRYLVTERPGAVKIFDGKDVTMLRNTPPVLARSQGGMLDIALHPDYEKNGWIYLAFSKPFERDTGLTAIVRGRLIGDTFTDVQTVFDPPAEQATRGGNHWGVRMVFDGAGHLFFAIGDRGHRPDAMNPAQYLNKVAGKVHRVRDDGAVPKDNPFVRRRNAWPTVWCYGNRNIQGMAFRPGTGQLWAVEHGPKGGDELNLLRPGLNYGWPVVSFGINYDGTRFTDKTEAPGMEPPVIHWTPSIAVGGLAFYDGELFPRWKGSAFVTALAAQHVVRLEFDGDRVVHQERLLERTGRIRDVRVFEDGAIYLVYDAPGRVVRITPAE
jgi:glucose/arabinose dehydrogenase